MKKDFHVFELERQMGKWEHQVEYNLSESGVHPMTMGELLANQPAFLEELLDTELNYPQTNGALELRENIAALYPQATPDHVLVTTGAAQANFTTILSILDPGDEIVVMLPNYMQIWGIGENYGLDVNTFSLEEKLEWGFDIAKFQQTVTKQTKLIAICNPNNPTGHIMSQDEREAVIQAASKAGAWILSDEVYAGAEHQSDEITPSMWGEYDKVFAIGSMSKAYALPGLRIGWVVTTPEMVEEIWARQDYVTICPSILGNKLAASALSDDMRQLLIERTREYVRNGYKNVEKWVQEHPGLLSVVPPQAAAITFVHYKKDINSSHLVDRLIHEHETYVVPGDHFGMDHYLRISYGLADDYVKEGLRRISAALQS